MRHLKFATCILTLMTVLAMSGCGGSIQTMDEPETADSAVGKKEMRFSVSPITVSTVSMDAVSTRAEVSQYATRLELALFDSDGNKKNEVQSKSTDSDFGSVSMTVDYGTYTMVAVAHKGDQFYDIESPTSVKAVGKVFETFYYCGGLTVSASSSDEIAVSLKRAVAAVGVNVTDESLPDSFDHFSFSLTGGSRTLNPSTGYGATSDTQTSSVRYNKNAEMHGIFTFPLKDNDGNVTFTAQAIDADGGAMKTYSFDGLTIKPNDLIVYKGQFFYSPSSITLSIPDGNTVWNTTTNDLNP